MGLNRSSYYLSPATESEENLRLMRLIDQQFLRTPFYGSRRMTASLERSGETVNRKRVQRLMALMGLDAIFPKPRTTVAAPDARVYPYLLRDRVLTHVNEVWSSDITYEQAMEKLQTRPGRKVCEAMRGLVEEAQHSIGEQDGRGPIMDLVIVAGMQRIEHYEIAAYGTDVALAEALGEQEIVDLLTATLEEEKQTDLKLTEVTEEAIMPAAMEEGAEEESATRKRPAKAKAA